MLRRIFVVACAVAASFAPHSTVLASGAPANNDGQAGDTSQLLAKFSPILAAPQQSKECGSGERFTPIAVDALFNREDVTLRRADNSIITTAPSAIDLFNAGTDAYLDIPGNALSPGCTYEKWFRSLNATPTIYGRVATDPDEPSRLALQYWFYWPYNDWNNRHEGDWEMMQINFDVATATEALQTDPESVILAQHEGGELQQWDDISLLDDRPLVFPAAGSHATYFSANRWVGTSAQTGVGCDNTQTPARVINPQVIALPSALPTDGNDPFAWLAYTGHWGERHSGFNNGPTGPNTKRQWENPLVWSDEEGRAGSIALPPLGAQAAEFFCSASTRVSTFLLDAIDEPITVLSTLAIAVLALVISIRRTRWTPTTAFPIRARRRSGMLWSSAVRFMWSRKKQILPIVAFVFVGGVIAQVLRQIVFRATSTGDLSDPLDPNINAIGTLTYGVWFVVLIPVVAIAIAGVTRIMQAESNNEIVSFRQTFTDSLSIRRFVPSVIFTVLMFVLALFQVVLFWFTPRWILAPAFAPDSHPFKKAAQLTKGHRRHIVVIAFLTLTAITVVGPFVGALLLLTTTFSLTVLSAITALINAVLVVWGVVALNYLHADVSLQHEETVNALS